MIQGMKLITLNLQNVSIVRNSVEGNLTREQVVSEYREVFNGERQFSDVLHLQVDPNVPHVQLPHVQLFLKRKLIQESNVFTSTNSKPKDKVSTANNSTNKQTNKQTKKALTITWKI